MKQTDRIMAMEKAFDEASAAITELEDALENYRLAQPALRELEEYYSGPKWLKDFEDDAAGKIPKEIKRGVLSEDGVYDLLSGDSRVRETMRELAADKKG